MAGAIREAAENAIAARAVAALLIFETAEGEVYSLAVPEIQSVRQGLLRIATWGSE